MITFDDAGPDDADLLMRLESASSTAGLAHIFGTERPYPSDDVRARWALVLVEPGVTTVIARDGDDAVGFAAYDSVELRHFGIVPGRFGSDLAAALHDELVRRSPRHLRLWVLEDNTRARRFYEKHGWRADGRRGESEFPPFPIQIGYSRAASDADSNSFDNR